MNAIEKLQELKNLQLRIDEIRRELGISPPGGVTYHADLDAMSDDAVVVVADGFGGATTSVVAGNYPIDYTIKFERFFSSEAEAEVAADDLAHGHATPRRILTAVR